MPDLTTQSDSTATNFNMVRAASVILPVQLAIAGMIALHEPEQRTGGFVLLAAAGAGMLLAILIWVVLAMSGNKRTS